MSRLDESSSMSTMSESASSPDSDLILDLPEETPLPEGLNSEGETVPSSDRRSDGVSRPSFSASASAASSSSHRLRGDQVILFSFFSRLRAFANQVDTWVNVIFVMMASIIFSPFVG